MFSIREIALGALWTSLVTFIHLTYPIMFVETLPDAARIAIGTDIGGGTYLLGALAVISWKRYRLSRDKYGQLERKQQKIREAKEKRYRDFANRILGTLIHPDTAVVDEKTGAVSGPLSSPYTWKHRIRDTLDWLYERKVRGSRVMPKWLYRKLRARYDSIVIDV